MSDKSTFWNTLESELPKQKAFLGLDGCVDLLFQVVNKRTGRGDAYQPCQTMTEFSERIGQAAGVSCNIEIVDKQVKFGGNGPIMSKALAANELSVTYMGPLGATHIHHVFEEIADVADIISLGEPAATYAMEFDDGKVMLANTGIYDAISPEQIIEKVGQSRLESIFKESNLVALLNWSCIPGMTEVLDALKPFCAKAAGDRPKHYFFDLADLARRDDADIREVLQIIHSYSEFGSVTLGLNHGEARDVLRIHGVEQQDGLLEATKQLHELFPNIGVAVHATREAAYAGPDGSALVEGPYCKKPVTTTGAGDHFNAGFAIGALCELPPETRLKLGVLFSGYYVCKGITPVFEKLQDFVSEKDFII